MVKNIKKVEERSVEILRMGKIGRTTLAEIAETWGCSPEKIALYLHRLQEKENYAYLVDGKGCFRIFKDFKLIP